MDGKDFVDGIDPTRPVRMLELLVARLWISLDNQLRGLQRLPQFLDGLGLGNAHQIGGALRYGQRAAAGLDLQMVDVIGDDLPDAAFGPLEPLGFVCEPLV